MHPPIAEPQHFGRAPPSPRDEFPFPIVPPTTHSPPQLARFSPTSSTATTPRLVPRTRPTPLQAIPSSLSPVAPPRSSPPIPNPARHHFPVDSNPSAPHQALTLHPQHLLQSRFTETLPRHSPFSLPSPRPPSPLQLERTPSTDSSISPSIQLPAYEFPRRHPHRPLRMPYEQPVSRFSDWTSTNDSGSIDSPWDEPFPRADDSGGGGGLSRRGSMATGGSGARGWWRDAAPEGVGESDGDVA
ncbi:hypothetical protein BCR35DRAFT_307782 [Leucosporidium creatinivorum]|uniref:Uncharacterized protein n=1 Tax=Leucosporidium creatinivorum TaxID=106004 RepID=A0A1Y2EN07_9BASI|nr:hypothetical protein BCR35DRAFT_307782 [Leucosporidium creatinivorum]